MRTLTTLMLVVTMALTYAHAQDTTRAAKPMFKGVELYSWLDPVSCTWHFSLLPGTNRNKMLNEIIDPKYTINNVKGLKHRLAQLAIGEYVFWWPLPDPKYPSHPPQSLIDDIVRTAATLQINLETKTLQ